MNPIHKRLKLPVHFVNGRWEFFYGGAVRCLWLRARRQSW